MSWPCRLLPERSENPQPGDMWLAPWMLEGHTPENSHFWLSAEYWRDHAGRRPPVVVALPNGALFCPDAPYSCVGDNGVNGWTVTGTAPRITVSPSINLIGRYHGWLRAGVLSDDCEGRTF